MTASHQPTPAADSPHSRQPHWSIRLHGTHRTQPDQSAVSEIPPFDSVLGRYLALNRKFLNSPEIAALLRRGRDFVEALIQSGELDAHTAGTGRKFDRKRITILSVARYLAASALYDERDTYARLLDLFAALTPAQRRWAIDQLTRLDSTPQLPTSAIRK